MSEYNEPLLTDPTSYVSPDGNVLPFADIEAYQEPVEHDLDPAGLDELEAAEAALHAESLYWPVAEIPVKNPEVERSENYRAAKARIDEGIAASIAANSPYYKVKVWVDKTHLHNAKEVEMSLGEYLAGGHLSRTVSTEEYLDLLNEYNPINKAYNELHKDQIVALEAVEPVDDLPVQKLGGAAAVQYKPSPIFESGHKHYTDPRSAAAHDFLEDDE